MTKKAKVPPNEKRCESVRRNETITCPACGRTGEFPIWHSLNADLDPAARDELVSGALTRYVCSNCGKANEVVYPMLHHDMTGKLMVNVVVGRGSSGTDGVPPGMMAGYRLRIVSSRNDLVGKIRIAAAGLDDRLVEIFKVLLRKQAGIGEDSGFFYGGSGEGSGGACFVIVRRDGNESIIVPNDSFTETLGQLAAYVRFPVHAVGEWERVDMDFAMRPFEAGDKD